MCVAAFLPELDEAYDLPAPAIQAYQETGHVLLRSVLSAEETAAFRRPILDAVAELNRESRPLEQRDTYGRAFLQTMNLWRHSPAVAKFVLAKRLAKLAADLMGVPGVRLYHDQALFKEAGGGLTPWHQDQHYWPLDTRHTITLWMPLVDVSANMGTMSFASGSHRDGYLGDMPISDDSQAQLDAYLQEKGYPILESGDMRAGDATFHAGWTIHGAPGNIGMRTREVMTVIYFADGARVAPIDHANRQADLDTWLPGLKPGDVAATELNPLLWPA